MENNFVELENIMAEVEVIVNSIWRVRPIEDEPKISLVRWQVIEVGGERHFMGYNSGWEEGRVSSRIVVFDGGTKKGITKSGRVYQLVGETGIDRDAHYVLRKWLYINGFKWEDIQWRMV